MNIWLRRRHTIAGLVATWLAPFGSAAFAAAATDRRLVVILLRGALDGLAAVPPYGEKRLAELRGPLVPPPPGTPRGMADLGGFFGLHPELPGLAALYRSGSLLIVNAAAGATRSRSHFDAQDSLECGTPQRITSGWLNRVVAALPPASDPGGQAFSVGVGLPLLLRGPSPAESWLPEGAAPPPPDLFARIAALNATDPALGRALTDGMRARGFATSVLGPPPDAKPAGNGGPAKPAGHGAPPMGLPALAQEAGRLLAAPDGPRIAALEIGGWDTHAGQVARLAGPLRQLDQVVAGLHAGLGDAWGQTCILVMTEFGRTVRMNGTGGTDHGTAGVAFVAGGAVAGGRVAGTWPGLAAGRLFEDRDLAPTTDLRSVACGVLAGQYGFGRDRLRLVFPGYDGGSMAGVLRV
jgi:uncharacterized protein (DUF1501 family)